MVIEKEYLRQINKETRRFGRYVISVQDIEKVLDKSYRYLLTKDSRKNVHEDLLLAFEGYTLYYGDAFKGAYLYGWMLIETIIDKMCKEYAISLDISSSDKKKLEDSSQRSSYYQIELLFALKKIEPIYKDILTQLRIKRNKIIHDREPVERYEPYNSFS